MEGKTELVALKPLNWLLFAIGMAGLWLTTHSWQALLFGWVASLHISVRVKSLK
jgi:hypothetical protein